MPRKKDPDTKSLQRALGMYFRLVQTGRKHTMSELAEMFECSKQTVRRMMDELTGIGYAEIVESNENGRCCFQARVRVYPKNAKLEPEDVQQLLMCRDMVRHLLPESLRKHIEDSIDKTRVLVADEEKRDNKLVSITEVEFKGGIDYTEHQEMLETLHRAVQEKRACRIDYKASAKSESRRHYFAPLKIIAYREALYIGGFLLMDGVIARKKHRSILAVHRLKSVELLDMKHEFEAESWKRSGLFGLMDGEPFTVKVRFSAKVAEYVKERNWSDDQSVRNFKDGDIELEFKARSRPEVLSWVLSFGTEAKLLRPKEMQKEIKTELEKTLGQY